MSDASDGDELAEDDLSFIAAVARAAGADDRRWGEAIDGAVRKMARLVKSAPDHALVRFPSGPVRGYLDAFPPRVALRLIDDLRTARAALERATAAEGCHGPNRVCVNCADPAGGEP